MIPATRARALTHNALLRIKEALDEEGITPEEFLGRADAIISEPSSVLELPNDTSDPDPLNSGPPGASGRDVSNAPLVYEFLGAMDPANAADGRLWTYLAFHTYRSYMEQRWPLDPANENWQNRVTTRWLLLNPTRGRLVRHGIARLWWIASLTYDPRREHPLSSASGDPFAYTAAVLGHEDRVIGIFDREISALPSVVRAVLEHASAKTANSTDSHIRTVMKELTLVYGYRDIGILNSEELTELLDQISVAT